MEKLPVIFRAERTKEGDVTAVFPTLPADMNGYYFTIYAHVGQHGSGGFDWYHRTRRAKPEEYAELLDELRDIYSRTSGDNDPPYELVVYQRMTSQHREAFRTEARRLRMR